MICPYCKCDDLRVIDSRPVLVMNGIRRRRECTYCKKRITTYEVVNADFFSVQDEIKENILMGIIKELDEHKEKLNSIVSQTGFKKTWFNELIKDENR